MLRVITQNLLGRYSAWTERQPALREGLRALRGDLFAFQEAIRTDEHDQVTDLLGPGYHVAHQTDREADGSGVSIASRWPLVIVHELDLRLTPRTSDFPAVTLAAEIHAPDPIGPLLFVNHKPSFRSHLERERELQAVAGARFVEDLVGERDLHVVLAGDQDAEPDAASIRFWCGRQSLDGVSVCYRDAWEVARPDEPGHTFMPGHNPLVNRENWPRDLNRRIDYVFVRCAGHGPTLSVSACTRILDTPLRGVWASDHFGVAADLAPVVRP